MKKFRIKLNNINLTKIKIKSNLLLILINLKITLKNLKQTTQNVFKIFITMLRKSELIL